MAKSVTVEEQHLDRQPPTVAILATAWWEATIALVKLQECGLEMHPPVKVCCYYTCNQHECMCKTRKTFCPGVEFLSVTQ